VLGSHLHLIEN